MDEPRNIVGTVECFIHKDGKYLMLHRSPHKRIMPNVWMAPGGKREFNEGLYECVRREVLEETGLTVKNIQLKVTGSAYLEDLDQELLWNFLIADYAGGELTPNAEDGTFEWLTLAQIKKLDNLLGELQATLPQLFDGTDKVYSAKAVYSKENQMTSFLLEES